MVEVEVVNNNSLFIGNLKRQRLRWTVRAVRRHWSSDKSAPSNPGLFLGT